MSTTITFAKTLAEIKELKVFRSSKEEVWDSVYEKLESSITVNDDVPILEATTRANTTHLRQWLLNQKNKLDELNDDQKIKIKRMIDRFDNGLGLPLEVTTQKTYSSWMLKYKEMNREFDKMGKSQTISQRKHGNPSLAKWVANQKVAMRENRLARWKISLLQKSGVKPAAPKVNRKINEEQDNRWNRFYELLKAFREQTGHCAVPRKLDSQLSKWVYQQKELFERNMLRPDRKEKLDALGYCWEKCYKKQSE